MLKKILLGFLIFSISLGILSVSLLRSSSIRYAFSAATSPTPSDQTKIAEIDYVLPYQGRILPDSPFWIFKAARDRIWLFLTTNPGRKAELKLLFADKRLSSSKILFEKKKPDLAFSTLTKAEKYLEEAHLQEEKNRKAGMDTSEFLIKLAKASLKHRQTVQEIFVIAPEDAKPGIVKVEDYAKNVYKACRDALNSKGIPTPQNPFNGDN